MKYLILIFIILFIHTHQNDSQAIEFEENEINLEVQQFNYKSKKTSMIIIITKNEKYNINSYEEKILTVFNKITEEYKEFILYGISYCIIEEVQIEKEIEYTFKFKNYKGGSFIVYSSTNSYPLKYIEKGFNLQYYFISGKKDVNLTFYTEILKDNIFLDIYPGDKIKIKKISTTGEEEALQIKNNFIELPKDYKYNIEFFHNTNNFEIAIKKREIIHYNKKDELKLNLYNQIPNFILIKPSEFNSDIIYTYLYYYDYISYEISISEVESETIENWNDIEFINKTRITTQKAYEIYNKNINENYLLIQITIIRFIIKENKDYFYIFKIFHNFQTNLETIKSQEETLIIIEEWRNKMIFINSNISNLRTFEIKESKSIIYQRESDFFIFIVLPTEESYILYNYSLLQTLNGEIFFNEKSFHNYLSESFDSVTKPKLWYFDINEAFTFYIKSYFGSPKIYYTSLINQEVIDNMEEKNFEKIKEYNISYDIIKFDSPFALYIDPYENTYLNFILDKDNNLDIMKDASNKYLIKNKVYNIRSPGALMIRMDEKFDLSNIIILKNGTIISKLNKDNPNIKIDEPNDDINIKSDSDSLINFYYNINELFFGETISIITFPNNIKGNIMIVKIISKTSMPYYYAINYGYDNYIPPDTKKVFTTQSYFYIDDPYSILNEKNENLNYYLVLFDKNINYEISYIKKYEKEKNLIFYKIKGNDNYAIISDLNYQSDYYTYELLLCENNDINITLSDVYNTKEIFNTNKIIINQSNKKALFTFESKSDFIFFQKENEGYQLINPEIKYYIPKIENSKISILLVNNNFELNTEYSIILLDDNNKDDELLNKLDNECFLFSLINNEIKDINYEINNYKIKEGRFLYEEIDYTKYSNSKYLLIKIYSCKNEKDICVFSKTQRIYLENLEINIYNEDEFGVTKIDEFTEYKITRDQYIFSYDYKNYLNILEDIFIYIFTPTQKISNDYMGELEVINPSMENYIFKYRYTETISLIKDKHIISNGRYYFIFKNCSGVSFYLHNIIHFFPLNKINNYISETDYKTSYGDGLIYFTMDIEEDKYIYLEWNIGQLYLYSILYKTTEKINFEFYNAYYINKGSYILILDYGKNYNGYHFSINMNHYILDLEPNKEIKVDMGIDQINQPTVAAVVDLSKYDKELYLVSDSKYANIITCEKNMDINSIIENGRYGRQYLDTHIIKIDEINQEKCNPPYYNIKLFNSRFEIISDIYDINTSQNFTFRQKETIGFTVRGEGYNIIFSNQENMKWLNNMQNDFLNFIISNEQIQFKLKPNENEDTNLRIYTLENIYNISIDILNNNEIPKRIRYGNNTKEINYYINLSKNKYLINHFDHLEKIEFYISKEEINGKNIKNILNTNDIDMSMFDLVIQNNFEFDNNKILALKKEKNIFSELSMTPLIHDFIIEDTNSKFILENKKYYLIDDVKILLEENSEASIKIYDLNNNEINVMDKNNPIFENKIYNQTLYLKSNENTLIYVYYHIKENSKNIINKKNDDILIVLSSDCENNKLKYCFDNGFENYMPLDLNLINLQNSKMIIHSFENDGNIIQKGTDYTLYYECETHLINNISDYYENSTFIDGSYLIENNKYFYQTFDKNKQKIFYQIFECNENNNYEFYASIDENKLDKLNTNNSSFIQVDYSIELYLKTKNKNEFLFNYYNTLSNEADYNKIEKNDNPHFNISYISRNEIKVNILPKYKNIEFEFYFFAYVNNVINNSLSNKCYLKKTISFNNNTFNINNNNIIIQLIEYKNGELFNNNIKMPNLRTGEIFHSNILGKGKIFEDIEEYIFYEEQIHIIKDSDFPFEESNDNELNIWVIIGIVIGVIVLIIVAILLFLKCRKHDKIEELDKVSKIIPLAVEN